MSNNPPRNNFSNCINNLFGCTAFDKRRLMIISKGFKGQCVHQSRWFKSRSKNVVSGCQIKQISLPTLTTSPLLVLSSYDLYLFTICTYLMTPSLSLSLLYSFSIIPLTLSICFFLSIF